mmetsp:Transcript_17847/g.42100  ORF Transcript_17847/g.42100 Transcript_17847/m.42100 type:complete len:904 (+) Transcript_17847:89-2800(+)|eukprot:CAMPEP_0168761340 /NCGR_PEP_ID=MMETSP0724-20121128/23268_1 /TAXON_ID=265536 /ORGANISM="Amphiprora sp., Strain CCMP467" /LENGTH=903 /DNA_ID=CAMNT_0008810451 /DNA_START=40 /DNA_END=2751 /DNA_ORIENTATION=+
MTSAATYPSPPNPDSSSKEGVVFSSPFTSIGKALLEVPDESGYIARLQKGIAVDKVTSFGDIKPRILTLSTDRFALFITHARLPSSSGAPETSTQQANSLIRKTPLITRKGILAKDQYLRYLDVADLSGWQTGVVATQTLEESRTGNKRLRKPRLKGVNSTVDDKAESIVSILYHGHKSLNVLVPSADNRTALLAVLRMMRSTYHMAKVWVSREALLVRYIWYDVDADQDQGIGLSEFKNMLQRINFAVSHVDKAFADFAKEVGASKKGLSYGQVMVLLQRLKNKQHGSVTDDIWTSVFGAEATTVSASVFLDKFLLGKQGMSHLTETDAENIISTLSAMEYTEDNTAASPTELTKAKFRVYLFDPMNAAYDPAAVLGSNGTDHAQDYPMSRYWINSSHNTYLTGDQLNSNSSVEAYMNALRRGCKCLELDCWDGEKSAKKKPLPVIYHGLTLTSKILFEDVIRCVKAYLMANPDTYPIILSLENHCSLEFQETMASDLETILGDFLYVPDMKNGEDNKFLPSPRQLIGKVVIKGKRPPDKDDDDEGTETAPSVAEEEEDLYAEPPANEKKKKPKVLPALARLTLFHGTKYKDFNDSIQSPASHMHSISETKITKILSKQAVNAPLWQEYNINHLTRTYPKGARVNSSNYNPILAWATGSQVVALNFQTPDMPLMINDGRFLENRRCGYILKPESVMSGEKAQETLGASMTKSNNDRTAMDMFEEYMLGASGDLAQDELLRTQLANGNTSVSEVNAHMTNRTKPLTLELRIVAGSCLPKPKGEKSGETIDPYLVVTLHDSEVDDKGKLAYTSSSFDTKPVDNNGFCPIWKDGAQTWQVVNPEVAVVVFSLKEKDWEFDDRVAEAAIPINRLRDGYRSVQLFDLNNSRSGAFGFASLLVEIKIV